MKPRLKLSKLIIGEWDVEKIIDYCIDIDEAIYSPSDFGDSEIDSDDLAGIMELFD